MGRLGGDSNGLEALSFSTKSIRRFLALSEKVGELKYFSDFNDASSLVFDWSAIPLNQFYNRVPGAELPGDQHAWVFDLTIRPLFAAHIASAWSGFPRCVNFAILRTSFVGAHTNRAFWKRATRVFTRYRTRRPLLLSPDIYGLSLFD